MRPIGKTALGDGVRQPPFHGMKRASPQTGRVEAASPFMVILYTSKRRPLSVCAALFSSFKIFKMNPFVLDLTGPTMMQYDN